jgi:hypothetical protein
VSERAPERYLLLSSWRMLPPAAIGVGLLSALSLGGLARVLCVIGAAVIALLWVVGRAARPTLVVDDVGYRVEERGVERLRVAFSEVRRARAVAAEQAMYLDCGDPARNLLLPPRRGFGFRFDRQSALYVRLATSLSDKIEIVEKL